LTHFKIGKIVNLVKSKCRVDKSHLFLARKAWSDIQAKSQKSIKLYFVWGLMSPWMNGY